MCHVTFGFVYLKNGISFFLDKALKKFPKMLEKFQTAFRNPLPITISCQKESSKKVSISDQKLKSDKASKSNQKPTSDKASKSDQKPSSQKISKSDQKSSSDKVSKCGPCLFGKESNFDSFIRTDASIAEMEGPVMTNLPRCTVVSFMITYNLL